MADHRKTPTDAKADPAGASSTATSEDMAKVMADSAVAGKGYAPALLIAALRDAKRTGQNFAFVQADTASKAIYERIGFKPAGQFTEYRLATH